MTSDVIAPGTLAAHHARVKQPATDREDPMTTFEELAQRYIALSAA